jgi:hypothetical protein
MLSQQSKDADRDRFGIEPRYQWDTGGVSFGVVYIRDKTDAYAGIEPKSGNIFVINPALVQSWGPFSIHFEAALAWGKYTYAGAISDDKIRGLGLYLDAVYNYGSGDVTLMSWFADGTGTNDRYDHEAIGMGDFYPFLVAYNHYTLGNGTWTSNLTDTDDSLTDHWGIAILGNHSINDDIAINYGVGYFRRVSTLDFGWGKISKSLGWEIDLGVTFQLLDNLSFESKFGYMFNGSAYKWGTDAKIKDTFAWANVLAVTF